LEAENRCLKPSAAKVRLAQNSAIRLGNIGCGNNHLWNQFHLGREIEPGKKNRRGKLTPISMGHIIFDSPCRDFGSVHIPGCWRGA
jgi:hypothetical protein